jgi:hypothetical protein
MSIPIIPCRQLYMSGTLVDTKGMPEIYANRAANIPRKLPSVTFDRTPKGRIAVVGYGPSLNDTWERIKGFDTIISTSKAHEFLLDRGLKPRYHMDLDSRKHKVEFMERPQPDVQYMLSSHIHPSYPPRLLDAGITPQMFHVAIEPHVKLDPCYATMKARFDVGVQAAEWAFLNGYREQHWFGIEYGCAMGGGTHAGHHWGVQHGPEDRVFVDVDGRKFECTKLFFHGLLLAEQFLCWRAALRCTIHGDGLLGHFAKARNRAKFTLNV